MQDGSDLCRTRFKVWEDHWSVLLNIDVVLDCGGHAEYKTCTGLEPRGDNAALKEFCPDHGNLLHLAKRVPADK